jgi:Flp pilus assembly protein TadB
LINLPAYLNVKPKEVMSLSILVLLALMMVSVLVIVITSSLISFALLPISFYVYTYLKGYPSNLARKRILDETSEMVLGILYIVIYMRHTPNLEGAVKFASKNLTGHLGDDFKKVLWNIQTKKHKDIFDAMDEFLKEWSNRNKPFVDSMNLVMSALHQLNEDRRKETLDMAVDAMLSGTYDAMVRYANRLRTPVQAVSLIGITLPILGLVMLPMVSAFLSDVITSEMIFFFYDLVLPIIVFFFINRVLGQRPVGFSLPDVSKHPDVPPKGRFFLNVGGKKVSFPVIIVPIIIFVIGVVLFALYVYSAQGLPPSSNDVFGSLTIVLGIAGALGMYFYLNSFQKIKIRNQVGSVEEDFTNAAYIISNMLSEGKPLETALIKVSEELKNSNISDFFEKIETNIKQLGMDVDNAIFDQEHGAIKLYPSMLVRSIMRILVSTSKESTEAASISMANIGRYTKSVHKIDEKIKDILSETISSINFQANFIAPLITGVVVGLSTMIFLILNNLGDQIGSIASQGASSSIGGATSMNIDFILGFLNISSAIDVWAFQPIVGLYLIIVVALMVYLVNKIEYAGDNTFFMNIVARTLFVSVGLYIIIVSITTLLFTGLADIAITVGVV